MVLTPPRSADPQDKQTASAGQAALGGNGAGPLDPAAVAAALAAIGGGGGTQADRIAAMPVYGGRAYNGSGLEDSFSTVAELQNKWYEWTPAERLSLSRTLVRFGLIANEDDYFNAQKVWNTAVEEAANYYNRGGQKISPYDAIGLFAGLDTGWRTKSGGNGLLQPSQARTETTTESKVKMLGPTEAKALITDVFKSELGRAPSANELSRYTSSLAGAAKKNPVRATVTTRYDAAGRPVDRNTVESGGVDFQQVSQDQAQADPEYGAYQAATTYMNALLSAIGSP